MSSLAATQSDGYYLPPEYFDSGAYRKQSRNQFAAGASAANSNSGSKCLSNKKQKKKSGHNQWLKNGVVRFELPEKVVCLGCHQSVGRGTRFNAKKITTDQCYFSTKIYEFQLSCRNCQKPWVIRTNPKDRGFDYVSGVKRQAGQERNLVAGSSTSLGNGNDNGTYDRRSIDQLERAAVTRMEKAREMTEIEQLEQIRKLNEVVSASVNDADTNASIRKSFRKDRTEKRSRLREATDKGWRNGMVVLPTNDDDILAANETCYGRPAEDEKRNLSAVRKSSIFSSQRAAKRKKKSRRMRSRPSDHRAEVTSGRIVTASPVRSDNFSISNRNDTTNLGVVLPGKTETTEPIATKHTPAHPCSPSFLVTDGTIQNAAKKKRKKTLQLQRGERGLSVIEKEKETEAKTEFDTGGGISDKNCLENSPSSRGKSAGPTSSFSEMMAAYDSDTDSY